MGGNISPDGRKPGLTTPGSAGSSRASTAAGRDGDHVPHRDCTLSFGSFIQVLASGHPIGRVFDVDNIYQFSLGDSRRRALEFRNEDSHEDEEINFLGLRGSKWVLQ
jgi:hypothetical protein